MIPSCLIPLFSTLIIVCNLAVSPFQDSEVEVFKPDPVEVTALAQTLYGECRGCSELQQKAVCWCVFNRVDDGRFPDTLIGVVSQPLQLQGYSPNNPVWDNLYDVAYSCIVDWHNGENRILDPDMCWFSGRDRINHFRNAWLFEDATKFWEEQ